MTPSLRSLYYEISERIRNLSFNIMLKVLELCLHVIIEVLDVFLPRLNAILLLNHGSIFMDLGDIVALGLLLRVRVEPFMHLFVFFSCSFHT
jgi:hypothetical protein